MPNEFKYGDRVEVWDFDGGPKCCGKFVHYEDGIEYPYVVLEDDRDCVHSYRFCRRALPDWPVDHPVWVRDSTCRRWFLRHFAGWSEDGKILCYNAGWTSHSFDRHQQENRARWDHWTDKDPGGEP